MGEVGAGLVSRLPPPVDVLEPEEPATLETDGDEDTGGDELLLDGEDEDGSGKHIAGASTWEQ